MNEISPLRQCVISSSNTFTLDVKLSGALSFKHDESDNFYTFKTEMKQFHIEAVTSAGYNEDADMPIAKTSPKCCASMRIPPDPH